MQIKHTDLKIENAPYFEEFKSQLDSILESQDLINGVEVEKFERDFRIWLEGGSDSCHCVCVGNGTDALEIALNALNLPKHSEVIICATTFQATAEAVLNAGLKCVVVDCDDTHNIDVDLLEGAITPRTSAIVITHLYGRIARIRKAIEIARNHNLVVVEDACQAHGAKIKTEEGFISAGLIGDIGVFSFYPSKNLGALGDGGAIVSSSEKLIKSARAIANHGNFSCDVKKEFIGRNSRMDSIQAAFLNIKLKNMDNITKQRRAQAELYSKLLVHKNISLPKQPEIPQRCVWHLYTICLTQELDGARKELVEYLNFCGIQTRIHYPKHIGAMSKFKANVNCIIHPTPNANYWQKNILSLPMGAHLSNEDIHYICEKINDFVATNNNL